MKLKKQASPYYQCIAIGASAGGLDALLPIVEVLPAEYPVPMVLVLHLHPHSHNNFLIRHIGEKCALQVKEADEKEEIKSGYLYVSPANYHLQIEQDRTFSLSIDEKICYSRPSIDVFFQTAAEVFGSRMICIALSGANHDGMQGAAAVRKSGGVVVAQAPESAESAVMPAAVIQATKTGHVMTPEQIGAFLVKAAVKQFK